MLTTPDYLDNQNIISTDGRAQTAGKSRKFRLKDGEKIPGGVRRIAAGQIAKALDHSQSKSEDSDEAIRKARVCMKKIRAVLRLVRGEIGEGVFKKENACFRDAARRLSHARDTAAMLETLDKLHRKYTKGFPSDIFDIARERFARVERREQQVKETAMSEVANVLLAARERISGWPIKHKGFSAIEEGLEETYREGRKYFEKAFRQPTTRNFHEWRKRVKSLEYQIRILEIIWPEMLIPLAEEIGRLTDHLSAEHDLAMLRRAIPEVPGAASPDTHYDSLTALIDRARTEARARARVLGQRIYAERPQALIKRLKRYWKQ